MPQHVSIQPGKLYPQPGYTVQVDKEGKWTATQIFLCHRNSAAALMPRPGTRHPEIGFIKVVTGTITFGEGDLADLLAEEHATIRAVADPLLDLIRRARREGLDADGWRSLKMLGLELAERLTSHAQKEEGALVPLVDDILDETTDSAIAMDYTD